MCYDQSGRSLGFLCVLGMVDLCVRSVPRADCRVSAVWAYRGSASLQPLPRCRIDSTYYRVLWKIRLSVCVSSPLSLDVFACGYRVVMVRTCCVIPLFGVAIDSSLTGGGDPRLLLSFLSDALVPDVSRHGAPFGFVGADVWLWSRVSCCFGRRLPALRVAQPDGPQREYCPTLGTDGLPRCGSASWCPDWCILPGVRG